MVKVKLNKDDDTVDLRDFPALNYSMKDEKQRMFLPNTDNEANDEECWIYMMSFQIYGRLNIIN